MSDIDAFRQNTAKPVLWVKPDKGIGGWLVFPMLGLMIAPLIAALHLFNGLGLATVLPVVQPAEATALVVYTIALVVVGVIAPLVLLVMLFRELKVFPGYYIWFRLIDTAMYLAGMFIVRRYLPDAGLVTARESVTVVIGSLAGTLIWINYMLNSERVRVTFVK